MNEYEEYASLFYRNATSNDTTNIERVLSEPGFDTLVHAFLDWAQQIFSWDRALLKLKAQEAINEWEI